MADQNPIVGNQLNDENLRGKSDIEIEMIWAQRRTRMLERRRYFEPFWRSAIVLFFQGILEDTNQAGVKSLYNPIYEQYDTSLYSRDGFRFLRLYYPLLHAVVIRKLAAEFANRPKAKWTSMNSNDPSKSIGFGHFFQQNLYDINADQEDFEVLLGKDIEGTSAVLQLTESYEVNVDDINDYNAETGEYVSEPKKKQIRKCGYRKIDLRNLLLDEHCTKSDLTDCNYSQVDEYLGKAEALQKFQKYGFDKVNNAIEGNLNQQDTMSDARGLFGRENVEFVRITHCFDRIADRYHILLNGKILNKEATPIPRRAGKWGKDIPIALAVDYKIPNAPYGYSAAHVTSSFNRIKNLMRQMMFEMTEKMAKPIIIVDPLSPFDEQGFEWNQEFIRANPNDIGQVKINPDLNSLYKLDELTDEDVIRATGINFNDTTNSDTGETARKTIIRRESQNAIIELGMNLMTNIYFKRVYLLLKDDILLHYPNIIVQEGGSIKVKTKGIKVVRTKGGFNEEPIKGTRYFDLKPEDIDMDFDLDLEMGNIATSKELEKAVQVESMDQVLKNPQGFKPAGLAQWQSEIFNIPDYALLENESTFNNADPKELANEGIPQEMLPESAIAAQQLTAQPIPVQPNQSPNVQIPTGA